MHLHIAEKLRRLCKIFNYISLLTTSANCSYIRNVVAFEIVIKCIHCKCNFQMHFLSFCDTIDTKRFRTSPGITKIEFEIMANVSPVNSLIVMTPINNQLHVSSKYLNFMSCTVIVTNCIWVLNNAEILICNVRLYVLLSWETSNTERNWIAIAVHR